MKVIAAAMLIGTALVCVVGAGVLFGYPPDLIARDAGRLLGAAVIVGMGVVIYRTRRGRR